MDRSFSNQLDVPEDHAAIREGVRAVHAVYVKRLINGGQRGMVACRQDEIPIVTHTQRAKPACRVKKLSPEDKIAGRNCDIRLDECVHGIRGSKTANDAVAELCDVSITVSNYRACFVYK
jgi:hypothetical protein